MESFDPTTGQVYVETAVIPVTSMISSLLNNCTGKKQDPSEYRNQGPGCSTLYKAALRSCVWNITYPGMAESLKYYNWHHGERIYRKLKETDTLSAKAWAIFRTAYPDHMNDSYHLRLTERRGTNPFKLATLSKQISSLPSNTLTMLCIRNLFIAAENLSTDLLQFNHLAVLVLEQSRAENLYRGSIPDNDDALVKRWGRAVHQSGSFKQLKVLMLKHFDISLDALIGLTVFPALLLCNLESSGIYVDLKDTERMGKPYKYRNKDGELKWVQSLMGPTAQNAADENPEMTWKRPDITASNKMEILYEYTTKLGAGLPDTKERHPALSIDLGDHRTVQYYKTFSAWFFRALEPELETNGETPKRRVQIENQGGKPVGKKRKVASGAEGVTVFT
ncbi:hypothetical protein P154DRAFT_562934 [Amniculicola lignicola CBS 123094]|uniref:Uncharacterized protein n=1 Tax=Amniculicola lignicola CBS 123094 TaxID=1392246 RepID=A0A6A5WGW3_9PLEO|nr:hypothetical protein P154DRAFT_562934 [Amniculicola lignicola CBS 123094]